MQGQQATVLSTAVDGRGLQTPVGFATRRRAALVGTFACLAGLLASGSVEARSYGVTVGQGGG